MRVRLALHAGEVLRDSYGVAGTAVNVAFRLLEAAPLKQALASSRGVLAVIASPWFFDDVITNTPGSEPASYRQVRVRVKETETAAWICRPDDPHPSTDDAELPPAHAAESWQLLPALSGLTAAREGRLAASVQGLGQAAPVGEAVPGQPVRLAPRPLFLAGRDGLLAELDARLAARPGRAGPQLVVLPGLGGAGKTSVAVEYAHRHLAEAGVCWQFAAEDPAVLAAEFAVLAAQLGVREPTDARDPVASVHMMLARATARWLALSRLAEQAPAAAGLVRLLAFLAPEPVPLALLLASTQAIDRLGPDVVSLIGPLLGDPVAAGDAVAALRRYSLVIPAGDGLVLMHRLVQAVTRAQLTAETASQWKQGAKALVDTAVPADTHLPATWPACAVLLPVRERVLGPEHLDTLVTRHEIAHWAGEAGNAAGARDQLTVLLPITERVMGPKHYRTFTVRAELAHWVTEAGDAPPDVS